MPELNMQAAHPGPVSRISFAHYMLADIIETLQFTFSWTNVYAMEDRFAYVPNDKRKKPWLAGFAQRSGRAGCV
jgi:hypothetical protein